MTTFIRAGLVGALLATSALAGCASTYYGAMEQIGFEKRDLLVQRVTGVIWSRPMTRCRMLMTGRKTRPTRCVPASGT